MKFVSMVALWSLLLLVAIPSCGKKIDKMCVKGKVRESWAIPVQGTPQVVRARPGDRIIRAECSEAMRHITFRNQYEALLDYLGY